MSVRIVAGMDSRHADALLHLYRGEWWSRDRTRDDVVRMLSGPAIVFGLEDDAGRLVACTRVLSDGVYKAVVFDVIVDPAHRGQGLMRQLFDAVLADPRIRGVLHLELYCRREHAPLYARWGFAPLAEDLVTMRRTVASGAEP